MAGRVRGEVFTRDRGRNTSSTRLYCGAYLGTEQLTAHSMRIYEAVDGFTAGPAAGIPIYHLFFGAPM